MTTIAITGSASGMGEATALLLREQGCRVVGVDRVRGATTDVVADVGTVEGRRSAVAGVLDACQGTLDGLVTYAGLAGEVDRPGSLIVSVNYFGTVELIAGLRQALTAGEQPAVVAISSNSTTTVPAVPVSVTERCLAGDEDGARAAADEAGSIATYPAAKLAVARWVRRQATTPDWIGAGITLNAIAPGYIQTPMTDPHRDDPVIGPLLAAFPLPVGRPGHREEIAHLVAYLLGPHGRFFCGSVLFCDGGTDAYLRPDDWPMPRPDGG